MHSQQCGGFVPTGSWSSKIQCCIPLEVRSFV
jgi:hypothetical protein